jgi:small nuclear ribonucleoprotein
MVMHESSVNRPFDVLNEAIGKPVLVVLKGHSSFRGTLKAFDVHMNLVLLDAEELMDGATKTKYGKVVLRGDNVLLISP